MKPARGIALVICWLSVCAATLPSAKQADHPVVHCDVVYPKDSNDFVLDDRHYDAKGLVQALQKPPSGIRVVILRGDKVTIGELLAVSSVLDQELTCLVLEDADSRFRSLEYKAHDGSVIDQSFCPNPEQLPGIISDQQSAGDPPAKAPSNDKQLDEFTAVIDAPSSSPQVLIEALLGRGNRYLDLNQRNSALGDFSRAVKVAPNDARAHAGLADALRQLHQHEKAIEEYSKAIELYPAWGEVYYYRAGSYFELGKTKKAMEDLKRAIRVGPDQARFHDSVAFEYLRIHQFKHAIAEANIALGMDPDLPGAHGHRAIAEEETGDHISAIEDYSIELKRSPDDPELYYNRGVAYMRSEALKNAVEDFTSSIHANPGERDAYYDRGFVLNRLGRRDEAIADYTEILRENPKDVMALIRRARIYHCKGNNRAARADLATAARIDPQSQDVKSAQSGLFSQSSCKVS